MDTALITVLVNTGLGGVVVVLIIFGLLVPKPTHDRALEDSTRKDAEIGKLQEALALERQRSDAAAQAGAVTNQLIASLVKLADGHREDQHQDHDGIDGRALPARSPLDFTGKDIGL